MLDLSKIAALFQTSDQSSPPEELPVSFHLVVTNEKGVVFDGQASGLATSNSLGPISILPGHTNFISEINSDLKIFDARKKNTAGQTAFSEFKANKSSAGYTTIAVKSGVLRVFLNSVEVYIVN